MLIPCLLGRPLNLGQGGSVLYCKLQDDGAKVLAFRLREPGFMRNFEGFWRMEPYPGLPQVGDSQGFFKDPRLQGSSTLFHLELKL